MKADHAKKLTEQGAKTWCNETYLNALKRIKDSCSRGIDWCYVTDLSEKAKAQLEQDGFTVGKDTFGASKLEWRISW